MPNDDELPLQGRRVLVTDGDQRAALAIVRSLGAAGATVVLCSSARASLAGASRFAALEIQVPDPLTEPKKFTENLRGLVASEDIDLLFPVTEVSLRCVLEARPAFDSTILPFPTAETFRLASNKHTLMQLADQEQIPVPRQIVLESREACESFTPNVLGFPLVLKPAVSVTSGANTMRLSVKHVADNNAALEALSEYSEGAFPVLVQERIVGEGIGIFLLRWDGDIVARFAHRRIREKPPSGGVSVYRESITPPAKALRHAEALLDALDWQGVAMVEFKQDARTATHYLMEINGRFWGSLQLAIDAGVDFPLLLALAALGVPRTGVVNGRTGHRLRWLLGDLDHLLLRMSRSRESLSLSLGTPSSFRTLVTFLIPWRPGDRLEVLRLSDARPFLRECRTWLVDIFGH